jgi:hydrogenase nickel incorporation protein HypA/HybF
MHEMSLAESVLQIIEDSARTQGFSRVSGVRLEIGRLAGVEAGALRFCFDAVTRGTLAEGARLEIAETPGQGRCLDCHRLVTMAARFDPCPACGGCRVEVTGGTELRVKELEVV